MHLFRASVFFILPALIATAYTPARPEPSDYSFKTDSVNYPATTPLTDIPLYQLQPDATSSAAAVKALGTEIERLYTHAKTLPSGHDRRSFETRIYHFEKRLRPLTQSFDLPGWETLRADVHFEWVAVQATITPPTVVAVVP